MYLTCPTEEDVPEIGAIPASLYLVLGCGLQPTVLWDKTLKECVRGKGANHGFLFLFWSHT